MKLIETKVAAEMLGVKPSSLEYWRKTGTSPVSFFKIGVKFRYDADEIIEYIKGVRVENTRAVTVSIDAEEKPVE